MPRAKGLLLKATIAPSAGGSAPGISAAAALAGTSSESSTDLRSATVSVRPPGSSDHGARLRSRVAIHWKVPCASPSVPDAISVLLAESKK